MLRSRTAHAAFHLRRLSASTFASTAPTLFSAACLLSLSAACLISRPIGVEPPSLLLGLRGLLEAWGPKEHVTSRNPYDQLD